MLCPNCNSNFEVTSFIPRKRIICLNEDDSKYFITNKYSVTSYDCPICQFNFHKNKRKLESNKEVKIKKELKIKDSIILNKLTFKKNISIIDVQRRLKLLLPTDAKKHLEIGFEAGILTHVQTYSSNKDFKEYYVFKDNIKEYLFEIINSASKEELINKHINFIKNIEKDISDWVLEDERLNLLYKILNNIKNNNYILRFKDQSTFTILSAYNNKFINSIKVIFGLGEILLNRTIICIKDFENTYDIENNFISRYRIEIEKYIGIDLKYFGLIKNDSINNNDYLPLEYELDLKDFELQLRKFILSNLLNNSDYTNLYQNKILPFEPNITKNGQIRKNIFDKLIASIEKDILNSSEDKLLNITQIKNELVKLSRPYNNYTYSKLFEQFDYKHYKEIFERYWEEFSFNDTISKQEFIDLLFNNVRVYRIDWAHVKRSNINFDSLNYSLYKLRKVLGLNQNSNK